jgi:hypothetical protein
LKANKAEQNGLVTLLNRMYGEIRMIEEQWNIRAEADDYRPRIEYFHDAIRALTASVMNGFEDSGRLSVEMLAYDISMLRYIQANPLTRAKGTKSLSPSTDLVITSPSGKAAKPDASVKAQLADLYKSYSVLFAALLSDAANRNYQNRINDNNSAVENLAGLEQEAKSASRKQDSDINIAELVEELVDDPDLATEILTALKGRKNKVRATEALQQFKDMIAKRDKDNQAIEKQHFTYVMSQLAVYEGAKDVVKKMAVQGMNLVGNFVESAVQEAKRGGGRGF